jgi:3-hydroxyacyl-[acyl-carrier-protein] dehydratase
MQYYEHKFDQVEGYLHHRPPYLHIGKINSIEQKKVTTETTLSGDEFFIVGHFPGAPILPGAMMQEMTTQSAGVLIAAKYNPMKEYNTENPFFNEYALGVLVKVKHARYRGFARPGDTLTTVVTLVEKVGEMFEFEGSVSVAGKTVLQNRFQLTNILSTVLQGKPKTESKAESKTESKTESKATTSPK